MEPIGFQENEPFFNVSAHLTNLLKNLKHREYVTITYNGDSVISIKSNNKKYPFFVQNEIDDYLANELYMKCLTLNFQANSFRINPSAFEMSYKRK